MLKIVFLKLNLTNWILWSRVLEDHWYNCLAVCQSLFMGISHSANVNEEFSSITIGFYAWLSQFMLVAWLSASIHGYVLSRSWSPCCLTWIPALSPDLVRCMLIVVVVVGIIVIIVVVVIRNPNLQPCGCGNEHLASVLGLLSEKYYLLPALVSTIFWI